MDDFILPETGPDARVDQARSYLAEVSRTEVDWLKPSQMIKEIPELRRHLAAVLAVLAARDGAAGVDSEGWTCQGRDGQMIGRRPAGDLCRDCAAQPVPGFRPMDTSDIDPETGGGVPG